jgi:phosphohistidine phosphatase SixA
MHHSRHWLAHGMMVPEHNSTGENMQTPFRQTVVLCVQFLAAALVSTAALAQLPEVKPPFPEVLATPALMKDLRAGGWVLYMRHGNTDNSRPDAVPIDLNNCETQRVLNDEGRQVVTQVGKYIRSAKIPVAEVIHSPLCRARDSAQLAFAYLGDKVRPEKDLMYPGNFTTEQKVPVLAMTRKLVSTPVAAGTNRVLVAHAPNMADLMGYFVKPEGTVVVLRPLGDGRFEYIASIHPTMWPKLLQ